MTKTTRLLPVAIALLTLPLASVARADTPQAGSNELHLEQATYVVPGLGLSGLTHESASVSGSKSSTSQTMFGVGVAYGHFVTDNVEIGSSANLLYVGSTSSTSSSSSSSSSSSVTGYGLSPFVRFFTMAGPHVGFFGTLTGGITIMSPSRASDVTIWSGGLDAGAEFFIVDSWSLRIGPTYRYIHESASSSSTTMNVHAYGVNWGLVGYF
jgi:hypothetical protein